MNGLLAKATAKKMKWNMVKEEQESSDSDASLSSDDENEVSDGIVFTLYNNRYIPIKYINRGTFSRVWVVYDIQENKLRAMKTILAKYFEDSKHELKINNHLNKFITNKELENEKVHLSIILDTFLHNENNKRITCFIYELLGCSIYDFVKLYDNDIPLPIIKKILKHCFLGLSLLHESELIHTDLKPENILTNIYTKHIDEIKSLFTQNDYKLIYDNLILELLPDNYTDFDKNKKKKYKRTIKSKAVKKLINIIQKDYYELNARLLDNFNLTQGETLTDISSLDIDELDVEQIDNDSSTFKDYKNTLNLPNDLDSIITNLFINIIDFGNCEYFDKKEQDEISIRSYRPPENIMNEFYNEKADIWAMACITFELFTGDYLFEIESVDDDIEKDRRFLFEMFEILGKIPKNMCVNCDYTDNLFDNKGRILKHKNCEYTTIQTILVENYDFDLKLALDIQTFLTKLFEYQVNSRYNAKQCLSDIFLN